MSNSGKKANIKYISHSINNSGKIKEKNPVNKKINIMYKNVLPKKTNKIDRKGVSVITCTHMYCYMNNIVRNFLRQKYQKKELILILNNNKLSLKEWKQKTRLSKNIRVYQLDEKITVGTCMNYAVEKSKYDYVANFDHDDYYGENYLDDFMKAVENKDAGLFGKKTQFVYFEKTGIIAIRNPNNENRYVNFIDGPTVFFKKNIFKKVKYIDSDRADKQLSYDCNKEGIKIYSINKENFCYIRRASKDMHTWKIEDDDFLALPFSVLGKTRNFKQFINKRP